MSLKKCPICGEVIRGGGDQPHSLYSYNHEKDYLVRVEKTEWCYNGCKSVFDFKTKKLLRYKTKIIIPISEVMR